PRSGSTPGWLHVHLDPVGLAPGTYQDSVIVSAGNAAGSPAAVPVEFVVHPCDAAAIALDAQLSDSLTRQSCAAPHRTGSFAQLYTFTGRAGDSVSIVMSAPILDGYVVLDTATTSDAPPLAQNDQCVAGPGACLLYQVLRAAGPYTIEATSGPPAATGLFTLSVTRPRPPSGPDALAQLPSDGGTAIPVGGSGRSRSAVFKGTVTDPNPSDVVRLEVEVEPLGTAFTGVPNGSGAAVANGTIATATVAGLTDNVSYHWQARAVDQTGRAGPWASFGGNAETAADFKVAMAGSQLVFTVPPTNTAAGAPITPAVQVTARDASGNTATQFTGNITVALGANQGGATLGGVATHAAVAGVASFPGLSLNKTGSGYTLTATTG